MFRLFQRIPRGLEPIAEIFKEHVVSEGEKLVKEVTEAIESKKDKEKDAAGKAGAPKVGNLDEDPPPAGQGWTSSLCLFPTSCVPHPSQQLFHGL